MLMSRSLLLALLSLTLIFCGTQLRAAVTPALPVIPTTTFNVTNYGAIGNDVATNTSAFQSAIDAASKAGGGVV